MDNNNFKTLSPKLDVVFQALFGEVESESITKDFLEKILKRKIQKIDLSKNLILRREFKDDKLGVLDILAILDNKEQCNIELQIIDKKNIIDRILYYWSRLYSRQIKSGHNYSEAEKTIIILIADFKLDELNGLNYISKWKIIEENKRNKILTDKFELDIIELPKIQGKELVKDELLDWLYFLENPKSERVIHVMKDNKKIKEASDKLCTLSEDEKLQRIADLREKAIMDEKAIYAKGLDDSTKKIAKKLKENDVSIEIIKKSTGLSEDEIKKL